MERIFAGEVYDVLPQPNGIVFSYCKEKSSEHVMVSYKMLSFENNLLTDVAKNIYLLSKFGSNYRNITENFENHITARSIVFSNGKVFALFDDGKAALYGADGESVWEGVLKYKGSAPSDIAFFKGCIWACFSENNLLLRFNMITMKPELRIGGKESPFKNPKDIFISDDFAIISNPDCNKLLRVSLDSYEIYDFKTFSEPVYSYTKVRETEFVLMESGLYKL